jgi:hypothetical protein
MSRTIRESDWKLFRELHPVALERFCQRVLAEVEQIASFADKTNHERYLAVSQLLKRRDIELAKAFDDARRSTALQQLACLQTEALLTEVEMARFSLETRETVRALLETYRVNTAEP